MTTATTTTDLNMRDKPTTSGSTVLTVIPRGATVTITGAQQGAWFPVTYGSGWVAAAYLVIDGPTDTQTPREKYVADLMALTERMRGLYYHFGGNFTQEPFSAKRGDCSGFVGWTANECGYQPGSQPLYNYTADQMFDNFRNGVWDAERVELGNEQAGDIVFFGSSPTHAGHVVIATGKGRARGASHGYRATTTDAAAKKLNPPACVCDDNILEASKQGLVGIFRPPYR